MFLPKSAVEKLLTCQHCLKKYDMNYRLPKLLPCQETICSHCVKQHPRRVQCEACKSEHDLTTFDNLFNNRTIVELLKIEPVPVDAKQLNQELKQKLKNHSSQLKLIHKKVDDLKCSIIKHHDCLISKIDLRVECLIQDLTKYRENYVEQVKVHRDYLLNLLELDSKFLNNHEKCSKIIQNLTVQLNPDSSQQQQFDEDLNRKLELKNFNDLKEEISNLEIYLDDFEKNMFVNFEDSYEILNSSFVGSLNYFMDNYYKTKFNQFNNNKLVNRINFIKNQSPELTSTLLLSKTLILNLYKDNTIEIYDYVNKCKLIDLKVENEINFLRSYGKYILASFKCGQEEYQLNLLDFNLNKIKSALFDHYYDFECMNDYEIIVSVKTTFRILNWELHEVSSIELREPKLNRFITSDHYWLCFSHEQKLYVWKHETNNIDLFNKLNAEHLKTMRVENLNNSEFLLDLNSNLIVFNYETCELQVLDLRNNFEVLIKCTVEMDEKCERDDCEMFITSDNQITIVNSKNECFYVI